jgi:hypothetical protein
MARDITELWRAIQFSHDYNIPLKRQVGIADLWLRRRRCCPLSVCIDPLVNWPHVFATIIPHRSRWDCLKFDRLMSHFPAINCLMPLLRQLDLILDHNGDADPAVFLASCELPLLRTAILNDRAAATIILPWVQLTRSF